MTDILKSLLYYVLMLSAFALMIFTIGCSTENPLCSDNYCVEGEIFLRSQLLEGEEFSEVNVVESQLLAAFANTTPQTPVDTTPALAETEVSLADIIADVALGSETHLNQTVTVTGYVVWKNESRDSIAIYPINSDAASLNAGAFFFIIDKGNPETMNPYSIGTQYTFTVLITIILEPNEDSDNYTIGSVFTE